MAPLQGGRPLRLFMTADAVGGVWQYALDLTRGLTRRGIETTLAVLGPEPTPDQARAAEEAGVAALIATDLPLDWTAESRTELERAGREVARLAAQCAADIVHLNSAALCGVAQFSVPVVGVCHSCVATWWHTVRSGPLPEEFVWRTELLREGYRAAAALTAPTEAFAEATARTYRLPRAPTVVRNGRAPAAVAKRDAQPFAFTAGRLWDEGKNLAALDRAAARLAIPIEAAGPTEGPNGARIGLSNLRLLGRLSDAQLAERLACRPVFVSVAKYEPFGLAVLEAAQAGCALVLSDIASFRELWDGAAFFVDADDDPAIASALQSLLADPQGRTALGESARARAENYSVEAMVGGLMAVYRSVLPARSVATAAA
jgi:glycosyltransferase involved in cell wall biosynthesis